MAIFPIRQQRRFAQPGPGKFQMWWPESDASPFSTSATRQYIARTFEAAAGIESAFWNALFSPRIVPRSSEDTTVEISIPNALDFVMTFSKENGVRLHFDPASSS